MYIFSSGTFLSYHYTGESPAWYFKANNLRAQTFKSAFEETYTPHWVDTGSRRRTQENNLAKNI